jgi:pyruvate formate lyase activating enzyme
MIADSAVKNKVDGVAYTYSEPTIFFEYAYDTIMECRKKMKKDKKNPASLPPDFFHVFVSNGYFTKEMLDMVVEEKLLSAIRIDLKFMDDEPYSRVCGGRLKPVQDSIRRVAALRKNREWPVHLEVINLVIPKENDSDEDFRQVAEFMASVSPDIPLHFSRFFPNFRMDNVPPTDLKRLARARELAKKAGLNYVYIGNTCIEGGEDTHCPKCSELLIARSRFGVEKNVFAGKEFKGARDPPCPKCGEKINLVL